MHISINGKPEEIAEFLLELKKECYVTTEQFTLSDGRKIIKEVK